MNKATVAQLEEQLPCKQLVEGSTPSGGTIISICLAHIKKAIQWPIGFYLLYADQTVAIQTKVLNSLSDCRVVAHSYDEQILLYAKNGQSFVPLHAGVLVSKLHLSVLQHIRYRVRLAYSLRRLRVPCNVGNGFDTSLKQNTVCHNHRQHMACRGHSSFFEFAQADHCDFSNCCNAYYTNHGHLPNQDIQQQSTFVLLYSFFLMGLQSCTRV